ncbi:transcription factor [Ganoderma sinense ZZ0214-1]|uniref:Transcription factor n=1 Tax=Ganoderma sinense ZZ0214-1 TaxID=1077348 RepID=A0A2G8RSH8_9APHY|nr:transcription factor [Ganoderma sinense ZZ0214-1]
MSPVKCLECGLIWPSKNKAGGHKASATAHKLAYVCITCSVSFAKCKDLHAHEAAARHKPPQDLGPVMAAAQAAAERGSRAACTALASASGPSHAPAPSWEDDADADSDAGGYSCPVCECGLIWPSKNKAGGHKASATAHKLAYVCITCSVSFAKCKDLHAHEAAARHKPPQDLGPVMAAAQAAAERGSRAACTALASASGPSHAPAPSWEDDADADSDAGGYSCPVCYMEFETQDSLADHVSSTLPCSACMSCLDPFQTLEDHYWESDNHPKCRPCALGFENQAAWTAHQDTCAIAPLRKSNVNNSPSKSAGAGRPWQRSRGPARTPVVTTKTSFGGTSTSSATVSSVTPTSSGSGSWLAPPRPPPTSAVAPHPVVPPSTKATAVSTINKVPQVPFYCSKCNAQFSSDEELLEHFAGSSLHPKCHTCGVSFEGLKQWAAHKSGCPPPGSSTDAPAVVSPVSVPVATEPETTVPEDKLATEPAAEADPIAPLSPSSLLAVRMMLSYEDGRSTTSTSEHPSNTQMVPQPNGPVASTETTASCAGAEQEPITAEDPLPVSGNDDASNPLAKDLNEEPEEGALTIPISGRDEHEEMHWYDPALRAKHARPGPGVLPPLLASMLFGDPSDTLYSVSAKPRPPLPSAPPLAPTPDEVHDAIPHWSALFCPEHNGWVLLHSRISGSLPPLAREPQTPLPSQHRREGPSACGEGESWQANLTHHWHRYEKMVDAAMLNPPYAHEELLLDLYVCCQCTATCIVSDVVPGVIPASLVDEFTQDKLDHPVGSKTPEATVVAAWETVLTIIDNRLWKDEQRSLPVGKAKFREKIGWNDQAEQVFEALGFTLDMLQCPGGSNAQDSEQLALRPPPIDPSTPEGRASRATLLRAWVEISAWLTIYREENKDALKDYTPMTLHVTVENERELCEVRIGAHTSQIPRGLFPEYIEDEAQLEPSWKALGMTRSTYSCEHLVFAYLAQCRCDPANTTIYFTHLVAIADQMADSAPKSESESDAGARVPDIDALQSFIQNEKKQRGRFTLAEHAAYARMLGFGHDSDSGLGVELDGAVEDAFVAQAWRRARQRTWLTAADQAEKRTQLDDALRLVAEQRGSVALVEMWREERGSGMAPETAYQLLGVPAEEGEGEMDETVLLGAYSMRIEDRPGQAERIREALGVVAESRDSERLREFLATGRDSAEDTDTANADEAPEGPELGTEQRLRQRRIAVRNYPGNSSRWKTTIAWLRNPRPPRGRKWSPSTAGRV